MTLISYFCIIFALINCIVCDDNPIVTTKLGKVKGVFKTTEDGIRVNLYNGIRYGKPPVGDLRYGKPVPADAWEGVYDATKFKFACMQPRSSGIPIDTEQNEDCLFLSIWQPDSSYKNATKKKSVMLFIHGGSFEKGTIFTFGYDARSIVSIGDVIVVTINYRLGSFGFLYGGTKDAPGNVGLYDQILALKWTRDNIDSFGGDPESITIFGESAGSMSIGALIVSPLAAGLFRRAIMQSGSPHSYFGSDSIDASLAKTNVLAEKLNCTQASVAETVSCLRKVKAEQIIKVSNKAQVNGESFVPIYGDELMPMRALPALRSGKFNQNVDLLFGTVRDEGSQFVVSYFPSFAPDKPFTETVALTKGYINLMFTMMGLSTVANSIADFYTKGLTDDDKIKLRQNIGASFGDYHLVCPTVLFGKEFASFNKSNKAYAYKLSHPPGISSVRVCSGWMGVCHSDDVLFVFGFPILIRGIGFDEDDYKLSVDMITAWTTFAKTGTMPSLDNKNWSEAIDRTATNSSVAYMNLDPNNYRMVLDEYKELCDQFWYKLIDP